MPIDLETARSRIAGLERADPSSLRSAIADLAQPRLTGTEGADVVEHELRARFEALGYGTEELPFTFSAWPGRFGLSAAGGVLLLAGVVPTTLLAAGPAPWSLGVLVVGLALAVAPLLFLDPAIRRLPFGRVEAVNLLFRRPGRSPSWIIMAHRDSKSQGIPTLIRTVAIVAAAAAWLTLFALAALAVVSSDLVFPTATFAAGGVLVAAALALALSWAGNTSPGALDNGSGLAALLAVAERVTDATGGAVAFLLTDGEELGLAGARDVARRLPPVQGVINVDGLDDRGRLVVAEGAGWQRRSAPQLAAALLTAAGALDLDIERRPLPRTILVDHIPIARFGIPSLTLTRGDATSLLRVHRPADRADRLQGRGAAEAATLLIAAIRLLRDDHGHHLAGRRALGS